MSELTELPGGNIVKIKQLENVAVLLWNFNKFTSCPSVSIDQFSEVKVAERKLDLPQKDITSNVGWSYFTHNRELDVNNFTNEDKQVLKLSYTFPTPASEIVWLNVLLHSLASVLGDDYIVRFFDATKKTHHYCQFSGGETYTSLNVSTQPFSFSWSYSDKINDEEDEDASTLTASTSSPPTGNSSGPPGNVSPVSHGTSRLTVLSIEGKKGSVIIEKLKHQLWANMVIATVDKFIEAISIFTKQY